MCARSLSQIFKTEKKNFFYVSAFLLSLLPTHFLKKNFFHKKNSFFAEISLRISRLCDPSAAFKQRRRVFQRKESAINEFFEFDFELKFKFEFQENKA